MANDPNPVKRKQSEHPFGTDNERAVYMMLIDHFDVFKKDVKKIWTFPLVRFHT